MSERIIYSNAAGGIAIIIPAPDCGLTIEQIAAKDVPAGVPYLIVDADQIPADRTWRAAWEADFSSPDGYGADYGVGSTNAVVGYDEHGNPIVQELT